MHITAALRSRAAGSTPRKPTPTFVGLDVSKDTIGVACAAGARTAVGSEHVNDSALHNRDGCRIVRSCET